MKVTITFNKHPELNEVALIEENNFYSYIAKSLNSVYGSDVATITTENNGFAEYQIVKKGGTSFIKENYSTISVNCDELYDTVYLTCVNPEWNNYKYYKLEDLGNGEILATYGRIGAKAGDIFGERTHIYPKHMYMIKLLEKLNKGYKDQTDIYISNNKNENKNVDTKDVADDKEIKFTVAYKLYTLLQSFSRRVIQKTYVSEIVTQGMIDASKKYLSDLYNVTDDIDYFNWILLGLISVSPRRIRNVEDILAKDVSDFNSIIQREEDLIMAMEGVVGTNSSNDSPCEPKLDGFSQNNIEIFEATEKQTDEVMSHLSDNLKPLVKNIYRVINKEQKERFDSYLKNNDIKKVKQFWHGSRNENWLSIILNGLLLKPNAVITGKMLGDGIYFAPSSMKSWGYTSYYNTYWAKGSSDTAFMGLYACAYGKPKDVSYPYSFNQNMLNSEGFNCVHAHAGSYLRNDEVVFYDENAILLNYIVEFKE